MSDSAESPDPLVEFDQTNGVVEGLEGDDSGAVVPKRKRITMGDIVENERGTERNAEGNVEMPSGETRYSEEGNP